MSQSSLSWPPTKEHFTQYMTEALKLSDDKNVTALVYCDNPKILIFNPLTDIIRCETQSATARQGDRSVKVIIGKED